MVASADIGDLGPSEGPPVTYTWNPLYNLVGILPWLLILLAFIIFKENRRLQALWILLPVLLLKLVWAGFAKMSGMPSESSLLMGSMIDCLLVGFVLIWLMAERIGRRNRFVTWLLAWLVLGAALLAMIVNLGGGMYMVMLSIFIGLTFGILMVSFPLAAFSCRKRFSGLRFSLWLALWVVLATFVFYTAAALIQVMASGLSLVMVLMQILMVVFIYAGILVASLLPFEILWFKNAFWRKRFEAIFGNTTRPAAKPVETAAFEPPPTE